MTDSALDTDVLIVGAGPVGLFLANECARRGLRFRIVEDDATQSEHSKALAIFPRTLEVFDMAGLVAPFLEAANPVTAVTVMHGERRLASMHFAPEGTPYSFVAMVPQNVTEQLLLEALRRKGFDVEYETRFITAEQHDDYVTVTLDHKGQTSRVNASFVAGCDGAHSAVRHLLNIPFEGAEYKAAFMLGDIQTNDTFPSHELLLCSSEAGPLAVFPMSATRRRMVATIDQQEGDAPSLELVQKVVAQRAPAAFKVTGLNWSSYFHIHHRHVSKLRVGRFFVAGDAAHIHSPFGGQGMNTGLQDAWNLVWKLDLYLHGHGNEDLLDSYSTERLPVIRGVIHTTDFLTKTLGTPNKVVEALRDAVIPMVSRLAPFQHAFVRRLSELGIAYDGSPIVEGPGKRYWDNSLRGGNGIRSRFLLILDAASNAETRQSAELLTQQFPDVVEFRQSPHAGITLVRPDGYITYPGPISDGASALDAVRLLLEKQTGTDHPNSRPSHAA
ncbi:MAG TPA: FAD-dependent monooxygenase [Terriglobales bacterium]|nr:FAD-dependent monooxygenase [Terriglobales bacterium]